MVEITEINKNKTIKQSNRLIEAKYKLTHREQLLMMAICSQLDENAEDFSTVRIKVSDFADFCKISTSDKYTEVKRTVMRLLDRKLLIYHPNGGWYGTHWLQSAEYIPNESVIEYKIDERLKPDLLQLKSGFLRTKASDIMEFRRDYSIRVYFILKKMLKVHDFKYNLDFFRERFELGKSYNLFANLKNKVLDPAIEEINEKSDIKVWHEYIKDGRAYKRIHFIVELKQTDKKEIAPPAPADKVEQPPQLPAPETATPPAKKSDGEKLLNALGYYSPRESRERRESRKEEPIPAHAVTEMKEKAESTTFIETNKKKWNDQQQADYDLMLKHGVWAQTAQKYIATYDHERIERNIQGVLKSNPKGNIRDIGAVMANAIAHDTYLEEAEERAKAQARAIERAKAEAIKAEEELIKDNERREKNAIKNEELAKIRANKSKNELVETFEKVLSDYQNNNKILTEEMRAELAVNGIPETDFSLYQSETMRTLIKYI